LLNVATPATAATVSVPPSAPGAAGDGESHIGRVAGDDVAELIFDIDGDGRG
jgi:hypothetical protein